MDCENLQSFDQSAVSALNSFLNLATEFYSDDISMLNRVHCHVQHDRVPIPCYCYYFVIHLKPAVSWLSYWALTLDLKSPAN